MGKYDLSKFRKAHKDYYKVALSEIRKGRKKTHWMWFIFPQLKGLGNSVTAEYYGIHNLEEAREFLEDEYLGSNLREISQVLLTLDTNNPREVFPHPDHMKLRSSMTLFMVASEEENSVYEKVIEKYFDGIPDNCTLEILKTR
ncbi:MAG: DUF1810 domain-containing protein [Ruminococcaceae bacterium]|nr:DUF1810 domain-containing protein [Oscillospiraceae bacterium]